MKYFNATRYAYIPVDIPYTLNTEEEYALLNEMICEQKITQYNFAWNWIPARIREDKPDLSFSFFKFNPNINWIWNPTFYKIAPKFCNAVDEYLPMEKLTYCAILHQYRTLHPHQDVRKKFNNGSYTHDYLNRSKPYEPVAYRAILSGRQHRSLYVTETNNSAKQYCYIPKDISFFVFSENIYYHGADLPNYDLNNILHSEYPPSHDKLVAFFGGIVDFPRHNALLRRSIDKFNNYCIRF